MLLLYQVGSVKVGEVVRYTVTYTPSQDRILPSPECLHLRIKNSSSTALRAAFVHGPYTLSVAAYPSHFDPNKKFAHPRRYGVPEFEPMLKAGGSWGCRLLVPDNIRQTAGSNVTKGHLTPATAGGGGGPPTPTSPMSPGLSPSTEFLLSSDSVSWIIEVSSQVIFSASAAVHYEILLARDEKSLNLSTPGVPVLGGSQLPLPQPGRVGDYQPLRDDDPFPNVPRPQKGVFSAAVVIKVEDTAALWATPKLGGDRPIEDAKSNGQQKQQQQQGQTTSSSSEQQQPIEEGDMPAGAAPKPDRRQKVHLVILTHGLHSNLGADMLFLKESIDAGVKQAKLDARERRARESSQAKEQDKAGLRTAPDTRHRTDASRAGSESDGGSGSGTPTSFRSKDNGQRGDDSSLHEDEKTGTSDQDVVADDEEVVVRGFAGNATRTERGIKYLGKRLARYVLSVTYPDQPFLPASLANAAAAAATPAHKHSGIRKVPKEEDLRTHRITKISFIGHSLGGLVQMYAIAYIQKHSPQFFTLIEPINFIALASPLLGLNHENPLYLKFALDFGLVGRTGQDLGLTWRAPTIARSGWSAIVSNLGENAHKKLLGGEAQEESKPLLRILPTGPAHVALKAFRNRTLYSNVVNDGIVPLRTSCLLFLDWQGLGRVEKARREAGLVETVVGFGWSELMGANVTSPRSSSWPVNSPDDDDDDDDAEGGGPPKKEARREKTGTGTTGSGGAASPVGDDDGASTPHAHNSHEVPQPAGNAILEDDKQSIRSVPGTSWIGITSGPAAAANPFTGFFNLFRRDEPQKQTPPSPKQTQILKRSQTLSKDEGASSSASSSKSRVTTGHELADEGAGGMTAPPKTTLFEAAGDLLNPKLPSVEYLIDPSKRPRTIFHDRVYHPSDIPPPPLKKRPSSSSYRRRHNNNPGELAPSGPGHHQNHHQHGAGAKSSGSSPFSSPTALSHAGSMASSTKDYDDTANTNPDKTADEVIDSSGMRVEEKIARAYHRGLSWRKVLVKLEPDAHNNIIVRRKFANAFGWPVIKHLVDAHFSDSAVARSPDSLESGKERAKDISKSPDGHGKETKPEFEDVSLGDLDVKGGGGGGGGGSEEAASQSLHQTSAGDKDKAAAAAAGELRPVGELDRSASEAREATDTVSELLSTPPRKASSSLASMASVGSGRGLASPGFHQTIDDPMSRPNFDRIDSMTWSERDWADSEDESESEASGYASLGQGLFRRATPKSPVPPDAGPADEQKPTKNSTAAATSGGGWNWTEKIAGKGAARHLTKSSSRAIAGSPPSAPQASLAPQTSAEPSAPIDMAAPKEPDQPGKEPRA